MMSGKAFHSTEGPRSSDFSHPVPPMEGPRTGDFNRTLGNGRHSPNSPLKLFGQAKKKINDVFVDIGGYIDETDRFLQGVESDDGIVKKEFIEKMENYKSKVAGIREILKRDRMKVAFFGRTSNGKSSVINAMLRRKILPSGIGHTTNCFLQVEGTDRPEGYCEIEGSDSPINIQNIRELASALSSVKLDHASLIRICWPKETCSLLKDDVVLVDSPGIDVSPDLDSWIDRHCMDADVFILVANAESTLMQTEKNFFHKVSQRLSKPNVFILNNRWDCSVSEPEEMEQVKQQHLERNIYFLVDELNVAERHEAEDRVFFVSAREALITRTNQQGGSGTNTPATPNNVLLEGHQQRFFEFCNFERKFEECISHTAVTTKFAQHTANGKSITGDVRGVMEAVTEQASTNKAQCQQNHHESRDKLDFTEKQLGLLTTEIKEKIRQMTDEVERKVSGALLEEIRRLAILVDDFERPFHPDPSLLNVYKKEMHFHVEEQISANLHARCSSLIHQVVDASNREIQERLTALLPDESRQQIANLLPAKEFEVMYRLDCRNLCADFQEDIEFRFSLGITALITRFLGPKGRRAVMSGYTDAIPRPIAMTPQTPSNEVGRLHPQENEVLVAVLGTFTSLYSGSTISALAIGGIVAKAAGWRVIAVCGAVYGLLYVYERLTWTSKARERTFKRQYVDYASSKLKLIVDLTSTNCSHQVQQELSSTFARLCRQVDTAQGELKEDMKKMEKDIERLDEVATRANYLKNKAGYLDSELNTFMQLYLKPGSQL